MKRKIFEVPPKTRARLNNFYRCQKLFENSKVDGYCMSWKLASNYTQALLSLTPFDRKCHEYELLSMECYEAHSDATYLTMRNNEMVSDLEEAVAVEVE